MVARGRVFLSGRNFIPEAKTRQCGVDEKLCPDYFRLEETHLRRYYGSKWQVVSPLFFQAFRS